METPDNPAVFEPFRKDSPILGQNSSNFSKIAKNNPASIPALSILSCRREII
jgi:hypothetical protein